jgi:GTP cyclohydrolase II/3,4-dihydroxy 2-butanone 4-phosphate synthase/GTP cyclohydrolase II
MILPKKAPAPLPRVIRYADSEIPTERGPLRTVVYRELNEGVPDANKEHVALVVGTQSLARGPVLSRVHSECVTSEVFGSLKCDCRQQFDGAVDRCFAEGSGVVLYLRQEGRGIGLGNKIRAYALQAQGADTVQANHQLGFDTDLRRYDVAAGMYEDLGVCSVRLMTNNPDKVRQLEAHGIQVVERVPLVVNTNIHSARYLKTKQEKCGHLIEDESVANPSS